MEDISDNSARKNIGFLQQKFFHHQAPQRN